MGCLALMLAAALAPAAPHSVTWADAPMRSELPQSLPIRVEPFSFQLPQRPGGAGADASAAPVHIAASGDWSEVMSSGFEASFESEGWEVQGTGWARTSDESNGGSYSAGVENFDDAPDTCLIYGGAGGESLQNLANARLEFSFWLATASDIYLSWAASSDGVNFDGHRASGQVSGWLSTAMDLKQFVGDGSVWLAFCIVGSGSGAGQNVYLDDVSIAGQEPYWLYLPAALSNYAPPSRDFHDNFSDPNSGWPVEHVEQSPTYEIHRDYVDGRYWMKLNYIWFHRAFAMPVGVSASGDYTLQVDLMYDFGDYRAEWGVIFEANDDATSYYMVTLYRYGPDLLYRIRRTTSGGEVDLADEGAPWFLQTNSWQWSYIRIVREGDEIRFYGYVPYPWAEWSHIRTVNAPPLSGERIGFTVFSSELGAEAYFDNLHLWQEAIDP
ncbi:MAG: hypothetical protein ACOYZ7_05195 [Chloroflexota bacterium]